MDVFFGLLLIAGLIVFSTACAIVILRFVLGTGKIIDQLDTIEHHTEQQIEIIKEIKTLLNDIRILLISLDEKTNNEQ